MSTTKGLIALIVLLLSLNAWQYIQHNRISNNNPQTSDTEGEEQYDELRYSIPHDPIVTYKSDCTCAKDSNPEENSVIFASYFTHQPDVHYGMQVQSNLYGKIKRFYESVNKTGMNAIIFHDNLTAEFVKKYQTPNITFHYVSPTDFPVKGFFVYEAYLRERAVPYRYVLATDLFDVKILKNVFRLFEDMQDYYDLFVQKEESPRSWGWLSDRSLLCSGHKLPKPLGDTFYNCGLIGGKHDTVLSFFHKLNTLTTNTSLIKNPSDYCCDMVVTNQALYTFMTRGERSRVMTGYPFHSMFFSNGRDGSDSFVAHK